MQETLYHTLHQALSPSVLEIMNESHLHNTPANAQSHFKVIIVSEAFQAKTAVKRHQMIYGLLSNGHQLPIHALALHTYTPDEWRKQNETAPASPNCRGGH